MPKGRQGAKRPARTGKAAFRRHAQTCLRDFETALAQVRASPDPEGPHRARVALRRLRALFRGVRPILDRSALAPVEDEARAIFRLLGRQRDADVLAISAGGPEAEALAMAAAALRPTVIAELAAVDAAKFPDRAAAVLSSRGWRRSGRKARSLRNKPPRVLARRALDRAAGRVRRYGPDLSGEPLDTLHALRKDLKTLRYLTEFASAYWSRRRSASALSELRDMQDDLGAVTDLALHQATGTRGDVVPPTGTAPFAASSSVERAALARAQRSWDRLRAAPDWWRRPKA